jgi:hypothetical protein
MPLSDGWGTGHASRCSYARAAAGCPSRRGARSSPGTFRRVSEGVTYPSVLYCPTAGTNKSWCGPDPVNHMIG